MKTRPYVAGVDTSTQSCKVVIYDPSTRSVIRQGRAAHPDGSEVDPEEWWEAFLEAVADAGGLDDVAALSVGGQQHGMVLLDSEGTVIRPALLWNDIRSAGSARELIRERGSDGCDEAGCEGAAWWAEATGSVPVASLTVTKLRWIADNEAENAEKIAAICLPHDYLTWKIMGSPSLDALVTDRSEASGTGYMARNSPEYRRDILACALHIDEGEAGRIILPKIAGPWDAVGHGDPERGWGHILIGAGAGDNAAAALGVDLEPGVALLSLGTSGVVSAVSPTSVADSSGHVTGFSDASGMWLPLVCTLNASRIIDAMKTMMGVSYEEFDAAALSVHDADGLVLVPYFEGERTPNLPDAKAELRGMTLANCDCAHVARASVEGLLTLMRGALDAMRAQGVAIEKVLVVGGGAKSKAVQALAAQFLDTRVEFPQADEYVALGAAKQAARVLAGTNLHMT